MLFSILIAAIVFIVILHGLTRRAVMLALKIAPSVGPKLAGSGVWTRSATFRFQINERFPALVEFIANRISPRRSTGLLLTLMVLAGIYLAALFSGLTDEVLEAEGIVRIDNFLNAAFGQLRIEPLISVFLWITSFGSSPAIVSAVIIATGFLWSQRRFQMIAPLWVTCIGSLATTSVGKFLIGRHRPEMAIDVTVVSSSFPSGHATAATAVYGFIAYAIARGLPHVREQFDVAYWTAVLVLIIGFSRIFLGVHYVTDVVGGFLVGGFWLLIGFTLAEWNQERLVMTSRYLGDSDP
jgi:membrane-associated phospholipid phosphatase